MGLRHRIKDPVSGIAQVVGCDPQPTAQLGMKCEMQLVVQSGAAAPFSCQYTADEVPSGRWPKAGDSLPVTFDRNHTDRMRVDWDQLATAAAPAAPVVPGVTQTPAGTTIDVGQIPHGTVVTMGTGQPPQVFSMGANSEVAKQAIARAEKKMNMDLDGDGTVAGAPVQPGQQLDIGKLMAQAQAVMTQFQQGGQIPGMPAIGGAPAPGAPAGPPDTISRLEELAGLHDRGVLTDAEFETQKQRILGES